MAKKLNEKLDHPKDIAPAALEFLIFARFKRLDGDFMWKGNLWKFSAYKVNNPAGTIRIDMRKL